MKTLVAPEVVALTPEQMPVAVTNGETAVQMSKRYRFIDTASVIEVLGNLGWFPIKATAVKPHKVVRKIAHTAESVKHTVTFRNPELTAAMSGTVSGEVLIPQITMVNSHNGQTPVRFEIGLFRLVCSNGLCYPMGATTKLKFRHSSDIASQIGDHVIELIQQFDGVYRRVEAFRNAPISAKDAEKLAIKMIAQRNPETFMNRKMKENGRIASQSVNFPKVRSHVNLDELIKPTRPEDDVTTVWGVFNVVQEKLMSGAYTAKYTVDANFRKPRPIKNATLALKLNKDWWEIADGFVPVN